MSRDNPGRVGRQGRGLGTDGTGRIGRGFGLSRLRGGADRVDSRFGPGAPLEEVAPETEIVTQHDAHALGGEGRLDVVVLVVVVVVGLEPYGAALVEQILQVEVADEGIVVHRVVAVTEVPVENQPVVEQLAREGQVYLHVGEVALFAAEVWRDVPVVAQLSQDVAQLRREGRRGHRHQLVVPALPHVHEIGGVEAVQGQQVDNLAIHHVVGADDAAHPAVHILREGGEGNVETEVGTTHIAGHIQDSLHRHGGSGQLLVVGKVLVEVEQVGRE